MTKPADTLARLRARSREAGRFVLALDREWADKLNDAYAKVRRLEAVDAEGAELVDARAELAHLEEVAGDNTIVFKFRRLSRPEYEDLLAAHPATEAQRKTQDDNHVPLMQRKVWNDETFEPALVAKVLIDPPMSVDEVRQMLRSVGDEPLLSVGEARQLVDAAMAAAMSLAPTVSDELRLP